MRACVRACVRSFVRACVHACMRVCVCVPVCLSFAIHRYVYQATVLTVLLYGEETWTVKARHHRRLESFYRQCIRSILGISRLQQWEGRLTTQELATRLGMRDSIGDCLSRHHLRWLGHVSAWTTTSCQSRFCLLRTLLLARDMVRRKDGVI